MQTIDQSWYLEDPSHVCHGLEIDIIMSMQELREAINSKKGKIEKVIYIYKT